MVTGLGEVAARGEHAAVARRTRGASRAARRYCNCRSNSKAWPRREAMQCAMRCKHLQDQLTDRLTALRGSFRRTIRRSAAEEEKCRLTLVETCDTAHPKRQNAAERGRALYRGRTRAERFCNRCGFIKRAPRGRRNAALGGLCGLFARASLCGCALAAAARARAPALSGLVALRSRRLVPFRHGDNRCAAVFSLPRAMLVNIDVVIQTWR